VVIKKVNFFDEKHCFQFLLSILKKVSPTSSQTPIISITPASVRVLVGQQASITCTGQYMYPYDTVWTAGSSRIYLNLMFLGNYSTQFEVARTFNITAQTITSTLKILNVTTASTITLTLFLDMIYQKK